MKKIIFLFAFSLVVFSTTKLNAQFINYNGKSYFLNGVNIPWHLYSQDFGTHYQMGAQYSSAWYDSVFTQCQNYGINCARIWLFTDGATSPEFDTATWYVTGLDTNFFSNLDDVFNSARRHHIMLIPSIWDFSMLNNDYALGKYAGMHATLIQDTLRTRSFINNALIPMVQRYSNQCNLLAWEIINEPEWVTDVSGNNANITQHVTMSEMQRFVGMIAEAIHQYSPKMVTVGSASLKYNSDVSSFPTLCVGHFWKDAAIQSAYNKPLAYLDFYEIHFYDWMKTVYLNYDPYDYNVSYWGLDKPTLIGESQGNSTKSTPSNELYDAFTTNYTGVLFWSFSGGADSMGLFSDFNSALLTFRNTIPDAIDFDTTSCIPTGIYQSSSKNLVSIYPIPFSCSTTIYCANIFNDATLKVYNSFGQLVKQTINISGPSVILQRDNLPVGMYFIHLSQSGKILSSEKLIITDN